jgi:hypothetical protein
MNIIYPDKIKWSVDLTNKAPSEVFLSKSYRKDANIIIDDLTRNNYSLQVEVVDEDFFRDFVPLYTSYIASLKNAKVHDIKEHISNSGLAGEYKAIVLRKNGLFIGAEIYRINRNVFSISYQVLPHELDFSIKTNLSVAIEYFAISHAIEKKAFNYVVGKDRNCYGQNAKIGLAQYKLNIGALPYISKSADMIELDADTYKPEVDSLIFYTDILDQNFLNKALLYTNLSASEIKNKYGALFKQVKIEFQIINY